MFNIKFSKPERTKTNRPQRTKVESVEKFDTVYKKAERLPLHIVAIETTESIDKNTACDHASLHNLFRSIDFKKDTRIVVNSNLEIHQFVSSDLVLQVEIKRTK